MNWRKMAVVAAFVLLCAGASTHAGALLVAGSPGYDAGVGTGYKDGRSGALALAVNNAGTAVGYADKYVSGNWVGDRAVRWDAAGTAATELGNLGISSVSWTGTEADAVNDAGMAVGRAYKYVGGSGLGIRAVRWDAGGTAATELGNLGTSSGNSTVTEAYAVNDAGTAAGYAEKYISGSDKGTRAVRWDAGVTAATELGILGTNSNGVTNATARAVNNAGTAVGYAQKYVSGSYQGNRPVRWDAGGTAATELGNLGTSNTGSTTGDAYAVNDAGTAVGYADKYVSGSYKGSRAVRWDASGTAVTELGNLGTSSSGTTSAGAQAVNDVGAAVGYAVKYISGSNLGTRAVRWDAGGTAATELGNLATSGGSTNASAYAVNDAGTAVGYANQYLSGSNLVTHAVIWLPDATAVDLNDLNVAPVSGSGTWTLNKARAVSADGWVAGEGSFDPDGGGPLASYTRLWVTQVGLGGTWTKALGGTWGRGPNWSTGTPAMQVGNATFNLSSSYTVALDRDEDTQAIAVSAGTVTIAFNGHTLTSESGLTTSPGATLKGAGTIVGNVVNAGTIAPGTSPGTLGIAGDLASTGMLEFEIAGATLYDQLHLSGALDAGGTIAVKLLDGYVPANGATFDLLDFGNFTDHGYALDFSQAALPAGLQWDTSSLASDGSIRVVPEPGTLSLGATAVAAAFLVFRHGCGRKRR